MSEPSESPLPIGPPLTMNSEQTVPGSSDNADGDLIVLKGSSILNENNEIYTIVGKLGAGQFGHVYEVTKQEVDTPNPVSYAIKISKNDEFSKTQLNYEIEALCYISARLRKNAAITMEDTETETEGRDLSQKILSTAQNVIPAIHECFSYKNHFCLVEDIGGPSLFACLSKNKYHGFPLHIIQSIAKDLLCGLTALSDLGIVHCDIKPENIIQSNPTSLHVKLVDFGCCMTVGNIGPCYAQTRFYRAPEVALMLPFDTKADIWSLGCTLCELYLALPILPAVNDVHLISLIEQTIGAYPQNLIENSPLKDQLFEPDYTVKPPEQLWREIPEKDFSSFETYFIYQQLYDILINYPIDPNFSEARMEIEVEHRKEFISFVMQMLKIDPEDRVSAKDALEHPFLKLKLE